MIGSLKTKVKLNEGHFLDSIIKNRLRSVNFCLCLIFCFKIYQLFFAYKLFRRKFEVVHWLFASEHKTLKYIIHPDYLIRQLNSRGKKVAIIQKFYIRGGNSIIHAWIINNPHITQKYYIIKEYNSYYRN